MKKIDELLDSFSLENEDMVFQEEEMSREEAKRIKKMTLQKLNRKKPASRRFILPLAAAMVMLLSFAAVFAQGGLSAAYHRLFGENIRYVNDMGTEIQESSTSNGITLNVANMVGDENSFYIIFELIKEDGTSFKKADYIDFEHLNLDFGGSGGYTWYKIEDSDPDDNKATFVLIGNTEKKAAGKKLALTAENFTEYSIEEPENKFDLYGFLAENTDYQDQELKINENKPYIPVDENMPEDEKQKAQHIRDITPEKVLPFIGLNIPAAEGTGGVSIDNAGFAEKNLCLRIVRQEYGDSSLGNIYFESKSNADEKLYSSLVLTERRGGTDYDYYIFEIKDMEELKNYEFKYDMVNKTNTVNGHWEVQFRANYKNTTVTVPVNRSVILDGRKYTVDNIKISPLSLTVKMYNSILSGNERGGRLNDSVEVIMEDGSKAEISSMGTSTNPLTSTINMIFLKPLDTTKIQKVKIGDIEIEM